MVGRIHDKHRLVEPGSSHSCKIANNSRDPFSTLQPHEQDCLLGSFRKQVLDILIQAEQKGDLNSKEYKQALATMLKATREDGIDKVMDSFRLDAIMAPTGSPAWKTDRLLGDHFVGGSSSLAAISGYPAITIPMGFIDDLPVGITFYGKAWSEPALLEIAYSYEQGTKHRKSPKYSISD